MIKAIKYCHEHDILTEFLVVHGRRVLGMLYEWKLKDAKKYWKEEAREEGLAEGLAEGRAEGHAQGHAEGIEIGQENRDKFVIDLIEQGLSTEEIKYRLTQTKQN